jgi:hypothetical protein
MHNDQRRPPKARVVFRVGVAGHRLHRLQHADVPKLREQVNGILALIHGEVQSFAQRHPDLYDTWPTPADQNSKSKAGSEAKLRVVASLAEGGDRIVAEEAIRLGFELQCPMPFHQQEFEEDFNPPQPGDRSGQARSPVAGGSVQEFRELLARAQQETGLVKFELDGCRQPGRHPYAAAARVVLNQSDVLLLIWDGLDEAKPGGTLDTLNRALAFHVPVVWIDARAPHRWQLLTARDQLARTPAAPEQIEAETSGRTVYAPAPSIDEPYKLLATVVTVLEPPKPQALGEHHEQPKPNLRETYFHERQRRWNWAVFWKLFRDAVGDNQFKRPAFRIENFSQAVRGKWPCRGESYESPAGEPSDWDVWLHEHLRPHYAWSDKLADYYADGYRSSFVLTYLLSAVAVFLALVCMAAGWTEAEFHAYEAVAIGGELVVILVIIGLIWLGNFRRWHERWVDYRLVAELIRQVRYLAPLGGGVPIPRVPGHLSAYGNPAQTWMYWHVRAIERELGLPNLRIDAAMLRDYATSLRVRLLEDQQRFHHTTHERMLRIDHRLHRCGYVLFGATLLACLLHFAPHVGSEGLHHALFFHERVPIWLTLLAAVLPALGAAIAAIRNHGEFLRVAKRSDAMQERLEKLSQQVAELERSPATLDSTTIMPLAVQAIQLMIDEVLDWRVVFLDRPLVPA